MKIVMFQYNRAGSAIALDGALSRERAVADRRPVVNRFLAGGYADRLLWEEAAHLRPKQQKEYSIPGNWQ
jgi:hypothetical protein